MLLFFVSCNEKQQREAINQLKCEANRMVNAKNNGAVLNQNDQNGQSSTGQTPADL